jgi:hypothetical protein
MENRKIVPEIKREMINFMLENYDKSFEIKDFCNNILREVQKKHLGNPSVYLSILTQNGHKYITAKTLFPIEINKFKEHRYYVGTLKEFPNGTKDERAKIYAKRIIKEKLVKKYKSITFIP